MRYAVAFEKGKNGYGAYVPDLPGCVALGDTLDETRQLIQEAIVYHIAGIRDEGLEVPPPIAECNYISVEF